MSETSFVDRRIQLLAERISEVHGEAKLASRAKGTFIMFPCPHCLELDGEKEIHSRHMAINATAYLAQTRTMAPSRYRKSTRKVFYCVKEGKSYEFDEIMNMTSVTERLPFLKVSTKAPKEITVTNIKKETLPDGSTVPFLPGDCIPVTDLPANHPGRLYLEERGYDLQSLYDQFYCCWCEKERPENEDEGIFYKRWGQGFRDTPQGRIVFFLYVNGLRAGWQARLLERTHQGVKEVWHPYRQQWEPAFFMQENKWVTNGVFDDPVKGRKFKPAKYKTAAGCNKNELLMGYDAAVAYWDKKSYEEQRDIPKEERYIIICEGPLDAARFGPPAVAVLGSNFTQVQARLVEARFKICVAATDNDDAGHKCAQEIIDKLAGTGVIVKRLLTPANDPGDMSHEDLHKLLNQTLAL